MASLKKKKKKKTASKKMGRPKVFDSEEKVEQLKDIMRLKPTLEDTAAFFKCGTTTIEDTIKAKWGITFREFREQNMVHTRLELQRKAITLAKGGNNVMLIFCLKNLCGWNDKQEIDMKSTDGSMNNTVVVIPSNGREKT